MDKEIRIKICSDCFYVFKEDSDKCVKCNGKPYIKIVRKIIRNDFIN